MTHPSIEGQLQSLLSSIESLTKAVRAHTKRLNEVELQVHQLTEWIEDHTHGESDDDDSEGSPDEPSLAN